MQANRPGGELQSAPTMEAEEDLRGGGGGLGRGAGGGLPLLQRSLTDQWSKNIAELQIAAFLRPSVPDCR